MKFERIFPKKSKILKLFSIYSLVLLVLIYLIFSSRFGWAYVEENQIQNCIIQDVISLAIWLVICVLSLFVFTTQNYYVLLKDGIVHHKWIKEDKYNFSDIIYIDEEYTEKHKTMLFYNKKGKPIYLVLDKDEKIFKEIKNRSKNLISKEEFYIKFPNA